MTIFYICIFFLGASFASFINATIYRMGKGQRLLHVISDTKIKRSYCENCKKTLTWYELIPIFGYIYVGGKCPKCKTKINIYYPISELIFGIVILLFFLNYISWISFLIFIFLFILSYYDYKENAVPRKTVHALLIFSICIFLIFERNITNIFAPLLLSTILMIINIFKKSFGFGDILVLLAIGILMTYKEFLVMFWLGIFLALLYSIFLIIKKKIDVKKAKVPMIPFFTLGYIISMTYSEKILEIFFNILRL